MADGDLPSMRIDLRDVYNEIVGLREGVTKQLGDHEQRLTLLESNMGHADERDTSSLKAHSVKLDDHETRIRSVETEVNRLMVKMALGAAVGSVFGGGIVAAFFTGLA